MPRTITIEQHAAFAVTTDNTMYRVSEWLDYGPAHDRFNRLDDPRFHDGQAYEIEGKFVKFFAVRSERDPDWNEAKQVEVNAVTLRGNDFLTNGGQPLQAVRDYATRHGHKGDHGGWIRDAQGNAITQGWFNYVTGQMKRLRRDQRVMEAVMAQKAQPVAPAIPQTSEEARIAAKLPRRQRETLLALDKHLAPNQSVRPGLDRTWTGPYSTDMVAPASKLAEKGLISMSGVPYGPKTYRMTDLGRRVAALLKGE
ncbi:hypothetical protein [Candidatus Solirubrobacter pratensis]|uniref:hypothetical protein n=1 Tax=Candidatus Solirubrobacter pratensis TaxID=1298857 RepID=UPI0003FAB22E|nr:hypothetical protein [Candidatus Solirubrobacter pratensis]